MKRHAAMLALYLAGAIPATAVLAGNPEIVDVSVDCQDAGYCDFSVTLRHADAGWEHYADRWEIVAPDGKSLGIRKLLHPHVDEQPFTRSLNRVPIPASVERVTVRAHDTVHGYGTESYPLTLPSH